MFLGFSKDLVQAMYDEIKDIYILRRTKADNIGKLPRCHFENVELEMYDEERRVYEQAFFESQEYISDLKNVAISIGSRAMQILECLLRVRQTMTWPQLYLDGMTKKQGVDRIIWQHSTKKMDTLTENISQHPEEKSVIFCQFRGEMDHIEHMFRARVFRIDGMVEKDERHARLEEFKNAPDGSVLVVQIKCGGVGLNIQCASRVYIMAPSWNPATELQAIGRCHRTGQTREVHVKKYLYTDTPTVRSVDFAMMALQGHKAQVCAEVLNDERVGYQIPVKYEKSIDAIRKIFRGYSKTMYATAEGSRAEVYHGAAKHTPGGLVKTDLTQDKYGNIKSKAAVAAAKKRMKKEGTSAMVKVFKPAKKGDFKLAPKKGTKKYKTLVKKMK